MGYKKVLKTKFVANCTNCSHSFDLDDTWMREKDIQDDKVPFSAKSSYTLVYCPNCSSFNLKIAFIYENLYRRRCPKCGQMFETAESWKEKCDPCSKAHAELFAMMGPG